MNSIVLFPLVCVAMFYAQVSNAQNTGCYNYFLQKDGCVWGSKTNPCASNSTAEKPCTSLRAFHYSASTTTTTSTSTTTSTTTSTIQADGTIDSDMSNVDGVQEAPRRLVRRYDTTAPTLAVAGGNGTCGFYNSTITSGVCLWNGADWVDGSNVQQSGWLNGTVTDNCNKQVYIQRRGQPETVQYAPVLDGCQFFTPDPAVGCFQIWLTIDLFEKFGPTPEELSSFTMNSSFTWDFNNLNGQNPSAAPI